MAAPNWFNVSIERAKPGSLITAVAPTPDQLHLFVTAVNGSIHSTFRDSATGVWASWFPVTGGEAALGSPITAVARFPGHLDLFVTGTDGRIYSSYWYPWTGFSGWFQLPGVAAAPGSPVTAVARYPTQLDLFVTGTDGRIHSTYWSEASGWAGGWFEVAGIAAAQRSLVTAVARYPTHLDLFVTNDNGEISSTYWDDATGWAGNWFQLPGIAAAPRSPVIVLARHPEHLDVFVTSNAGSISWTFWDGASGWASWSQVSGGAAARRSPVTAVARTPDHLDLYVTGTDSRIYTTHLRADATWQRWSPVPGFTTASGAWVTAMPRSTDQVDLFATFEGGGAVYSTALPFEWELFPPQPPTDLRVTEVADRKIGVAWKDRSNNEGEFVLSFRGKRPRNADHTGSQSLPANTESASITGLRSGYEYTVHVVAVNEAGPSGGPSVTATTPARTISVAKEGAGLSTVFVVKGRGFSPDSKVELRIVDGGFQHPVTWVETAEGDGTLTSRRSYPCVTGESLTVSAFESADPEGTVSNFLETSCP
jgi:hypothetical protein